MLYYVEGVKKVDEKEYEKIVNDPDFFDFVNNEFENTAVHATIEELAEFAYGSIEIAFNEFKSRSK